MKLNSAAMIMPVLDSGSTTRQIVARGRQPRLRAASTRVRSILAMVTVCRITTSGRVSVR